MAESPADSVTVAAACLCGQLRASLAVPRAALPLATYLCSCDTCRHVSGALCIMSVDIEEPLTVTGEVKAYATSSGPNGLNRRFCPTCGTTVYEDSPNPKRLGLAGGALTAADGIIQVSGQIFVADTRDGGLRPWLPDLPAWVGDNGDGAALASAKYEPAPTPPAGAADERLRCKCHCGGVRFDITRPSAAARDEPAGEQWWLHADGTKYAAKLCACTSCRKASGYDLQPWAYVPLANVVRADGSPYRFDQGTLKCWPSSPDVRRYFCGTCSATAFYRAADRPALVDVSVGLAEAPSGARAEEWLAWTLEVGYAEDALNRPLIEAVQRGMASAAGTKTA